MNSRKYDVGKYSYILWTDSLLPPFTTGNFFPLSFMSIVIPTAVWFKTAALCRECVIVGVFTALLSTSFLTRAWATEPGILETIDTEENREDGRLKKMVVVNSILYELIEFRAKYCKELDCTIERFDHFCPWTGNAVGVRNYPAFFAFLFFTIIHASFVASSASKTLATLAADANFRPHLLGIIIYCIGIVCLIGSLFLYHVIIVSQNITTAEKMKNVWRDGNPHDRGLLKNWSSFLMLCFQRPRISYFTRHTSSTATNEESDETQDLLISS
jgi:hypothetical protein